MPDLTLEGLAEWHEGEAEKARLGYGYHESDDFLNAAAFHQSAASLIRGLKDSSDEPSTDNGRLIAAAPNMHRLLGEAWGALNFILAFYEPGQRYLDTEAWKHAEAGGRRAHKALRECLDALPAAGQSLERAVVDGSSKKHPPTSHVGKT